MEERRTRRGYDFGEVASAFQKSVRRGLLDDALYWGVELYLSGFHEYAWKRMRVMCSEDIGPAEPSLPAQIAGLYAMFRQFLDSKPKRNGAMGSEKLFFVHAIMLLVRARKCRIVDHANIFHFRAHDQMQRREVPDWALDKHTYRGKRMGRGIDHFFDTGTLLENRSEEIEDVYRERAMEWADIEMPTQDATGQLEMF